MASQWQAGIPGESARYYTDLLYRQQTSVLDYFSEDAFLMIDDYARIMETNREIEREEAEWHTQKLAELRVFSEQQFGIDVHQLLQKRNLCDQLLFFISKRNGEHSLPSDPSIPIPADAAVFQPNGSLES